MKTYRETCSNCKNKLQLAYNETVFEKEFYDGEVIATYVECPVCGEVILKQLDTPETQELSKKVTKRTFLKQEGKLDKKQKERLLRLDKQLGNKRFRVEKDYWNAIYQLLVKN